VAGEGSLVEYARELVLRRVEGSRRRVWLEIIGDVPADDGAGLDVIRKTGQSLQGGPIAISWGDFEKLARRLVG
jgi:hypothetical protein